MHSLDPDWSAIRCYAYPLLMDDFLRRTGLADPSMVEWAAPLVLAAEGDSRSIARQLRMAGDPLTAQERRERGYPPRLQIGRLFADALLPRGMQDVEITALAISHYPFAMTSRAQMRWLCQYDRVRARMLIRDDEKTCLAARPYMKQIVPLSDLPVFPLPGCDKLVCRCNFDRSDKADRSTRRQKPELLPEFPRPAGPGDAQDPAAGPSIGTAVASWVHDFGRGLVKALLILAMVAAAGVVLLLVLGAVLRLFGKG